jgi:putative transposase
LHIAEEFTLETLIIECRRPIDADGTVAVLDRLIAARGRVPEHIRRDNGPEFITNAPRDWCRSQCADSSYNRVGLTLA